MKKLADIENEERVAAVIVDSRGIIIRVNRPFELLFGWTLSEVLGQPLTIIIPPSLRQMHQAGFSRLLETNQPRLLGQSIKLWAIDKAGREFIAEHLILGERRNGEWVFGATIRKVPAQK